jgi:hypothetical protein
MSGMCCEQLVCANCARPVAEAGCSLCRAARAEIHGTGGPALNLALLAVIVTALLATAAVLYGRFAG